MARKRFTPEQIVAILREAERGTERHRRRPEDPLNVLIVCHVSCISWFGRNPRHITGYEAKYGIGAALLGLKFGMGLTHEFWLFFAVTGGVVAFNGEVPTHGASYFNFMFNFGGGFELKTDSGRTVFFGYKLHHISNAGTAYENPGIDTNSFYVGTTWPH